MIRLGTHHLAGAYLALGLALAALPAFAGGRDVATARPRPGADLVAAPLGRGSAGNPIPLAGTETSAPGHAVAHARARSGFRIGDVQASLYALPAVARATPGWFDAAWSATSDVYTGGGMEVAIGGSRGLYVEGGRVTLRDPLDAPERDGTSAEVWTTSAGLAIRF